MRSTEIADSNRASRAGIATSNVTAATSLPLNLTSLSSLLSAVGRDHFYGEYKGWSTSSSLLHHRSSSNWDPTLEATESITGAVSTDCVTALRDLFSESSNEQRLALAVEASSHVSGLSAVFAQPWVYAGPGLGNMAECRYSPSTYDDSISRASVISMHNCLAGASIHGRDSLVFASVCMVDQCSARDLASLNFVEVVRQQISVTAANNASARIETTSKASMALDYVSLLERIGEVNGFLESGWTCGELRFQFQSWPRGIPFITVLACLLVVTVLATILRKTDRASRKRNQRGVATPSRSKEIRVPLPETVTTRTTPIMTMTPTSNEGHCFHDSEEDDNSYFCNLERSKIYREDSRIRANKKNFDHEKEHPAASPVVFESQSRVSTTPESSSLASSAEESSLQQPDPRIRGGYGDRLWLLAFDVSHHWNRWLNGASSPKHEETACLDGLRVLSMIWIMLGHCVAIVSSTGGGFSNPADFLPPTGFTTTLAGQLVFSSRLAVDTFLVVSGFLACTGIYSKLPLPRSGPNSDRNLLSRYLKHIPFLVLARVVRVLPLYAATLGFYTQIAPTLSTGPFWYQWLPLLKPCSDYSWTNLLFINNFVPRGQPTTDTCFYHSWYLAVDMQLFLLAPLLVFLYQRNRKQGLIVVSFLFAASVAITVWQSHTRHWSINTLDGAAVARYDIEAYTKPHTRAQSYLAGIIVAMLLLPSQTDSETDGKYLAYSTDELLHNPSQKQQARPPHLLLKPPIAWTWRHELVLLLSVMAMALVAFGTVTGAYSRRPCQYHEWPVPGSGCGSSLWPPAITFWYTALSRTVWVVSVSILMYLCLGQRQDCDGQSIRQVDKDGSNSEGYREETSDAQPSCSVCCDIVYGLLSCKWWTPLSELSLGVYLIHPIVIFLWQLSLQEKQAFSLQTFGMDFLSVTIVSYASALVACMLVEFPTAILWKNYCRCFFQSNLSLTVTNITTALPALSSTVTDLSSAKTASDLVGSTVVSSTIIEQQAPCIPASSCDERSGEWAPLFGSRALSGSNSQYVCCSADYSRQGVPATTASYYGSTESSCTESSSNVSYRGHIASP